MKPSAPNLKVLLVDPSLFTAPYDAALTGGLLAASIDPSWAVRPTRPGEFGEIPEQFTDAFFYRYADRFTASGLPRAAAKGCSHILGIANLIWRVRSHRPDIVHFQWTVLPPIDAAAILAIQRYCPVVLTVHDTVPFNGEHVSLLQNSVYDLPMTLSNRVIVHTIAGRDRLIGRGVPSEKIAVIPHGPLALRLRPRDVEPADGRWTCVLFGELKDYKGIDLLIEAVNGLPTDIKANAKFVIAGRPRMDLQPLLTRIGELGLERVIEVHPRRYSDQEMADLFHAASCFVFPYRQIDASGVYFLVKGLKKWIIASRVGIFAEDIFPGRQGTLVEPGDETQLTEAIHQAIVQRSTPQPPASGEGWLAIGEATRRVYEQAMRTGV